MPNKVVVTLEDGKKYIVTLGDDTSQPISKTPNKWEKSAQRVETEVARRPSQMAELIKNPPTFQSFQQHPLGTSLRTFGGAMELAEGIPANIGFGVQQGLGGIGKIPENIAKTAMGQRPIQYGDIMRASEVPILREKLPSSLLGMFVSASPYSPTSQMGTAIGKFSGLNRLVSTYGKPLVAKGMSILSGVPEEKINLALNKPQYLNKKWIEKEYNLAKEEYKQLIEPSLNDPMRTVNTQGIRNFVTDLKLISETGEWRAAVTGMKPVERMRFFKWEAELAKPKITLNRSDSIIAEMDSALEAVWKAKQMGKVVDMSDSFKRMTIGLRNSIKQARDAQHVDLAPVFKRYENVKTAQNIYKMFSDYIPRFNRMAFGTTAGTFIGGMVGLPFEAGAGAGLLSTVPRVQSQFIQEAQKIPQVLPQFVNALIRKK